MARIYGDQPDAFVLTGALVETIIGTINPDKPHVSAQQVGESRILIPTYEGMITTPFITVQWR
jgi:hypothetical protein